MNFSTLLEKYRKISFSEHDKGERFERLMQTYLLTDPKYASRFKNVWLWSEFHGKDDLGGCDTGIDLVARTFDGEYWAVQCKCYKESSVIDKAAVDSFLSTSSRYFKNEELKTIGFSQRLWISTTNKWGINASEAIKNQNPPVSRINLFDLQEAPVDWEKLEKGIHGEQSRTPKKTLRPHQNEALQKAHEYYRTNDRGKLIMACGTGKTFNALRIAENETNGKGLILVLVPSISLLGQILREWSADAIQPINPICICSDPGVSKSRTKNEDYDTFSVVDLALPASTNTQDIVKQFYSFKKKENGGLTVVFSTYQSIDVIARAQKEIINNGFGEFDFIICDEAHRTTGVSLVGEDESAFTKVHDNNFIKGKKRLYMTATPRLYSDDAKSKAAQYDMPICSMDDPKLYGEEIYRIGFGEAVDEGLLTDYKVLVLTLSDKNVPPAILNMITDKESEINADDASKLIGCINALSKQVLGDEGIIKTTDPNPMKRSVAFCQSIAVSKRITETFNTATEAYIDSLPEEKREQMVSVASRHIDGSMSAPARDELLGWLKAETEDGDCRVLTNVRCLSEGVDVPSLDSVMFLSARNSQVDVVQSVGRVMRKSVGKNYGYIIIPVVIPTNIEADKGLDENERYKVVWTVLNALRAHDDRFNATVNKIELNKSRPKQILVGSPEYTFGNDGMPIQVGQGSSTDIGQQLALQFEQLQNIVFARMVNKVGSKRYWEQWAKSVADIAERQVSRINLLITNNPKHHKSFASFLNGLQKNINPSITHQEAIEMLSQHIITKPVFEALFEGYSFVKHNPISVSMQKMLDLLEDEAFDKDAETLEKFYESVKMRASGIDNAEAKQRIIIELYDKFFKTAFPKMVEKLGIVYTPVEVVDFILHSVDDVLKKEFDRSLTDENIHILDPFTGTGTFITRLLQSGLIDKKDMLRKYQHEIYANEIVLLAYYIAAVNIENAFHDAMEQTEYTSFDGICLTDTFQLGETDGSDKLFSEMFPHNSERVARQKKAPLKVIIGNPPYSVGQKSANDNAQNQKYQKLEGRIASTYAALTDAISKISLYDSYIKAFRWSSDRLDKEHGGVIAFITNNGWLEKGASDGFRKCLEKEFSEIYVFDLKGAIRGKSGEAAKREGQNVFDIMTGVAICILVKNPHKSGKATIHYHSVSEYLKRADKIEILVKHQSILSKTINLLNLDPNSAGDWLNKRSDTFGNFVPMCDKVGNEKAMFNPVYSNGLKTQRDAWCYNSSSILLHKNIKLTIDFYNKQQRLFAIGEISGVAYDSSKISWTANLLEWVKKGKAISENNGSYITVLYRPFFKQFAFYSRDLNERVYQQPKLFPTSSHENVVICISGLNTRLDHTSTFISKSIVDLNCLDSGTQCFPLYFFEERQKQSRSLWDEDGDSEFIRRDGVSDFILERAKKQYGKNVTKEDVFYYAYGFLHSPEYKEKFANDLKKMLPRLPLVDDVRDFWAFSRAGRKLADLHINYEKVASYEGVEVDGASSQYYTVQKMRFPRKDQKDIIIYNSRITVSNIPAKAYEYVVNGKSAIEWVMERYAVTTHKESGIKNDPNDWAIEVGNPRYILDLLLSVINVSMQTMEIVESLPIFKFI